MEEKIIRTMVFLCLVTDIVVVVVAKEIDSKSDLLEEETMTIPAEHRAYPTDLDLAEDHHHMGRHGGGGGGGAFMRKNMPNHQQSGQPPGHNNGNGGGGRLIQSEPPGANDIWPMPAEASMIKTINVKCEKNLMKVNIEFDRPFHGLIFSKGYYSDPKCVHLPPGTGQRYANFDIYLGSCGMQSSEKSNNPASSLGLYIENTIIIQYDPQVQEIWDQARKLRCTWYDFYEKAVTFRPFNVDMLDAVTANFLGDNIQCWMQIQVGKGPWASEVAGIVKIGQTMTMVLAIKDEENKFDMLVRNCVAHDGKHQPIQLVDEFGCIVRPKIMSKFQKVKNFGHSATVVSYAYFQAFKFPDSMNVHFQCVIQVCRHECPPASCPGDEPPDSRKFSNRLGDLIETKTAAAAAPYFASHNQSSKPNFTINSLGAMPRSLNLNRLRRKRTTSSLKETNVNTEKIIKVVAPGDVAFNLPMTDKLPTTAGAETNDDQRTMSGPASTTDVNQLICMTTVGFVMSVVFLIMLLLLTSLITIFLMIRLRNISTSNAVHRITNINNKLTNRCSNVNKQQIEAIAHDNGAPYFLSMPPSINGANNAM